jgi:thiosulfate reductase cytochrome b subunit
VPNRRSFGEAIQVTLYELHLTRKHPPRRKFNGAQQIAYMGVVLMGAGSLITGLAIYKPTQLAWLASLLGGYQIARAEHFGLMVGYVLFFLVHVVQVARTGWNNFRSMITGYEIVSRKEAVRPTGPEANSAIVHSAEK